MHLTTQQQAILQTNENMVINAVAGSGKTTTLIEYARSRPSNTRILYLAFNKSVKTEAEQKFAAAGLQNVKVETAHSLAFDHVVKRSPYKVAPGYKSYEWADALEIKTGDIHVDYMIGNHVNKFISYFCNSTVQKVQELNYADTITEPKAHQFVQNFYTQIEYCTRLALAKMDKAEMDITHDFYLKKFQLINPNLSYDYILFDEGQDASGAMLQVFLQQPAIKVIAGDRHQQIYGWRFAVNSLQKVDFSLYPLSHSFRFDDEIALIANKILGWKKHLNEPPAIKVSGEGKPDGVIASRATVARTNLSLLMNAIGQWQAGAVSKVFFEGNINSYTFADEGASLYDVLSLYNQKPGKIKDKLLRTMNHMNDLEEYIGKTEDNSLRMVVDVVKQYGNNLPRLIGELKENHVTGKEEAEMIFSTVHRCKGMEYDEVTLLNDFITEDKLRKNIIDLGGGDLKEADRSRLAEEINVLYVAATRARKKLIIPAELNPLQSVQIGMPVAPAVSYKRKFTDDEDWLAFSRSGMNASSARTGKKRGPANNGKPWSREDENELVNLYQQGASVDIIAGKLKRGTGGINHKLRGMGLVSEERDWESGIGD